MARGGRRELLTALTLKLLLSGSNRQNERRTLADAAQISCFLQFFFSSSPEPRDLLGGKETVINEDLHTSQSMGALIIIQVHGRYKRSIILGPANNENQYHLHIHIDAYKNRTEHLS